MTVASTVMTGMPASVASLTAEFRASGSAGFMMMASTPAAMRLRRSSSWPAGSVLRWAMLRDATSPETSACALMEQIDLLAPAIALDGVGNADGVAVVLGDRAADARDGERDGSGAGEQPSRTCDPCDSFISSQDGELDASLTPAGADHGSGGLRLARRSGTSSYRAGLTGWSSGSRTIVRATRRACSR